MGEHTRGGEKDDNSRTNAAWPFSRGTEAVDRHLDGKSPFGAFEMAGNVGEWIADAGVFYGGYWWASPSLGPGPERYRSVAAVDFIGFRCAKSGQ